MTDSTTPAPHSLPEMQSNLRRLAAALRNADHLEPESQLAIARLLEELGNEFGESGIATAGTIQLAKTVNDVASSLNEPHPPAVVSDAQTRLQDAAAQAEIEAPVATGIVYRLIDLLSSMGI